MTDKRIVLTTAGSEAEARKLAVVVVEKRLAACVNIISAVQSVYLWEGKLESAAEWLLVMKTTASVFPRLREAILELHSYTTPECVSFVVDDGAVGYLSWLGASVEP
jgi:periplasmic divalent cation tolerance protein